MLKIGLFAGSYDPFTMGHYDIVARASKLFDTLYIGVAENTGAKKCLLTLEERTQIVKKSVEDLHNIIVEPFNSFLVDYAVKINADAVVRGIRTSNDFEYEKALAEVYKSQNNKIETLYLIASHNFCHISGSIVRELASMNASVKGYVHANAENLVVKFYGNRGAK